MTTSKSKLQADFDRIALLSSEDWDHNSHYHRFLLRHGPARCELALEIGCGTGPFSRLLAQRSDRVIALDLSPRMIEVARERSKSYSNIDYQAADATAWEFPRERFDCVASIATLHHLPFEKMLRKMKGTLRVGGTLLVLDLFEPVGVSDRLPAVVATPASMALGLIKNRRLRASREVQEAWAEHGRNDAYSTLAQVRRICAKVLPGARVRKHLLWRYSIVWCSG